MMVPNEIKPYVKTLEITIGESKVRKTFDVGGAVACVPNSNFISGLFLYFNLGSDSSSMNNPNDEPTILKNPVTMQGSAYGNRMKNEELPHKSG
mmetsp:Transcript_22335/g.28530  ORF Transcript_22335/g.28530 Transcript_22335/m.28530 type:complete len:94 (+) Transcript_22335:860-1141(+)